LESKTPTTGWPEEADAFSPLLNTFDQLTLRKSVQTIRIKLAMK